MSLIGHLSPELRHDNSLIISLGYLVGKDHTLKFEVKSLLVQELHYRRKSESTQPHQAWENMLQFPISIKVSGIPTLKMTKLNLQL